MLEQQQFEIHEILHVLWHIVVCTWNTVLYVLQICNLWASTIWATNNSSSYWNYYQFGKNTIDRTNWSESYSYDWKSSWWTDWWSPNDWWVTEANKTTATWANSSEANKTKMQWSCSNWYHISTNKKWVDVITAWWWWSNWTNLSNSLKLSFAGDRHRLNGSMESKSIGGYYRSSSPGGIYGYQITVYSDSVNFNYNHYRSYSYPIRCFKN